MNHHPTCVLSVPLGWLILPSTHLRSCSPACYCSPASSIHALLPRDWSTPPTARHRCPTSATASRLECQRRLWSHPKLCPPPTIRLWPCSPRCPPQHRSPCRTLGTSTTALSEHSWRSISTTWHHDYQKGLMESNPDFLYVGYNTVVHQNVFATVSSCSLNTLGVKHWNKWAQRLGTG